MATNSEIAAPGVALTPHEFPPLPPPTTTEPSASPPPPQYLYPDSAFQIVNPAYTVWQSSRPATASPLASRTPPPPVVAFPPSTQAAQERSRLQAIEKQIEGTKTSQSMDDLNLRLEAMKQAIDCTNGKVIRTV